ncbi:type III-A CRISPR-associated RAMP protein Csm3 [Proteiniclasticum ruminis]|uniref:type III-A CRISPR-associated RAMP protein Csm3 n=1 Tax=Proteiniclasticum ruminis TaxID=398199 RepID=UPI0028AA327E|nr:type III-A CRISPR-associated RAMP protein Csm3 [Proteiniclasticum ruminis]
MYSKIEVSGYIKVETGLHIGGSDQFSAIGSVDKPIFRDALTNLPMIPGSSIKGKMRSLLAKSLNSTRIVQSPDEDTELLLRIFGSAKKGNVKRSRLIFTDCKLSNLKELKSFGVESPTEVKFENSINRLTAVANPRQIERMIRGSKFEFKLIYDVENEMEVEEDFHVIAEGLTMLQYDYLGGHGSRGYGRISFEELDASVVVGEVGDEKLAQIREKLRMCSDVLSGV